VRPISFLLAIVVLVFTISHVVADSLASPQQQQAEAITPILLEVRDDPVPFQGSDGRTHLVYELRMTNFTSANASVKQVEVLGDGGTIATLDTAQIATRLQPFGKRDAASEIPGGTGAQLFIHLNLADAQAVPKKLSHRIQLHADAGPPGQQDFSETGGEVAVDFQQVAVIAPPLRGAGYISADSCCDAARHTRAALPVNGRVWVAQRYAVDWEEVDDQGRIYHGPQEKDESYAIYGKEALAVSDAKVVSVTDKYPSQTPGKYPTNITIEEADGNCVVLDLGRNRYALYAHLQQGKIRVHAGDTVKRGQVIGLVGNSGNSLVPHLHFHVMSTPSPLASNGLPYEIDRFEVTGATQGGTEAFDNAESKGTPLPITLVSPPHDAQNALPLDQLIITFAP
jgi:hypothetical protein